ncbi:hypothetical protein HZR84_09840 [Hyphobacterium sp. CCMP332]|nr:hypothetical protein HZR84_09840 [Hyphobacterium sp. CCMP332]
MKSDKYLYEARLKWIPFLNSSVLVSFGLFIVSSFNISELILLFSENLFATGFGALVVLVIFFFIPLWGLMSLKTIFLNDNGLIIKYFFLKKTLHIDYKTIKKVELKKGIVSIFDINEVLIFLNNPKKVRITSISNKVSNEFLDFLISKTETH